MEMREVGRRGKREPHDCDQRVNDPGRRPLHPSSFLSAAA